jgi:hypothetical protein
MTLELRLLALANIFKPTVDRKCAASNAQNDESNHAPMGGCVAASGLSPDQELGIIDVKKTATESSISKQPALASLPATLITSRFLPQLGGRVLLEAL